MFKLTEANFGGKKIFVVFVDLPSNRKIKIFFLIRKNFLKFIKISNFYTGGKNAILLFLMSALRFIAYSIFLMRKMFFLNSAASKISSRENFWRWSIINGLFDLCTTMKIRKEILFHLFVQNGVNLNVRFVRKQLQVAKKCAAESVTSRTKW